MSQVSYGTIAITDLTDIKDMYLQYCMAVDSITTAAAIEAKTTWTSPEVNWFTLTVDTTVNSNKRYYRLSNGNYYVVTPIGSENPSSNGWYEDTVYPSWQSGYQIWIREVRIKEGIELPEYGTPYLDKAVNQINTRIKKIWSNSTGSYMASGIGDDELDISDSSTYGFNSKTTTTGISFNYNDWKAIELDGNIPALKLYEPSKTSQGIQTVQIDSNGMKLLKGGIEAGQAGRDGFIYLSTIDYPNSITINGYTPGSNNPKWRQIIGTKFGVDSDGTLYASNVNISGTIDATSFTAKNYTGTTLNRQMSLGADGLKLMDGSGIILSQIDGSASTIGKTSGNNYNINITNSAIDLRYNTNVLNRINNSGMILYDGSGVADSNILAKFNTNGAQIGQNSQSHLEMDYHSLQMIDGDTNPHVFFHISDLRDENNEYEYTEEFIGTGYTRRFPLLYVAKRDKELSVTVSDGSGGEAYLGSSVASTLWFETAPTDGAKITVSYITSSYFAKAYTLGMRKNNSDIGPLSTCFGLDNIASGSRSFAEGWNTEATGANSHSEGYGTKANGNYSHAQGYKTIANRAYQVAIGRFNEIDNYNISFGTRGKYAFIIGNGTADDARSNALTVDWDGNVDIASGASYCVNGVPIDAVEDISDKFTFTSAWSDLSRYAYKYGKLVVFSLEGYASMVVAGSQYTMVTVASGYRPRSTTYYTGHGTNLSFVPQGSVNSIAWTSGDITVRPQTNTCNYIFVSGIYVLP